jgi:hypothetical protein
MSIRQQIVAAALARLQTITIANGCATDIGLNVFWWRRRPIPAGQLPAVVGYDTSDQITGEGACIGYKAHSLNLSIEVIAQEDEPDLLIRAAMDDIASLELRTVGASYWLDGLPDGTNAWCEVTSCDMDVDEAASPQAAARVSITVHYESPRGSI